jgi:transposase
MIGALCAGERDPVVLADMAKGKMRAKIPDLREALVGRFDDHHACLCRHHLGRVGDLEAAIKTLDGQVAVLIEPVAHHRDRLGTIPGVATRIGEIIIAEIGVDMSIFPTSGHLASWAGMCPGNNESAGKHFSGRTRPADRWLRGALVEAAWAVSRARANTYLNAQFWRIARRRGQKKAAIAVGHSILVASYHILRDSVDYHDLGGDWFSQRHDAEARTRSLVRQLQALGHTVTLTTTA